MNKLDTKERIFQLEKMYYEIDKKLKSNNGKLSINTVDFYGMQLDEIENEIIKLKVVC